MNRSTPGLPAGAATKSLESCLTLCNPIDGSPPGSAVPGILQAKILEWEAITFPGDHHDPGIEPGPLLCGQVVII